MITRLITKRKKYGEIIRSEDKFGNIFYILIDKDGNFIRNSNNYSELHKELYQK